MTDPQTPEPGDPVVGEGETPAPVVREGEEVKETPAKRRRKAAANREADLQADDADDRPGDEKDDEFSIPDERERWFLAPGLRRMQMDFSPDDRAILQRMDESVDRVILDTYADAYRILNRVFDIVREEDADETTGVVKVDAHGFVVWKKDYTGNYIEDWSRLTYRQREDLLFEVTTRIFEWEQAKERFWTRAMMAKAIFTERFAIEYDAPMSGTIDDRNAVGNRKSAEDRYFAIMQTSLSRRADAVVRTMNNLMLRLKDTLEK